MGEPTRPKPKSYYDCVDCPAFCCSVYERVQVTPRDIRRLAKHFGVTEEIARLRVTRRCTRRNECCAASAIRCLARRASLSILKHVAAGSITRGRQCVREFPITKRCAYYDLLQFEREQQDDPDVCHW